MAKRKMSLEDKTDLIEYLLLILLLLLATLSSISPLVYR